MSQRPNPKRGKMTVGLNRLLAALVFCAAFAIPCVASADETDANGGSDALDTVAGSDAQDESGSQFGSWEIRHFVDEFDQETDKEFITVTSYDGYFSNSLITRKQLGSVVIFEPLDASSSWYMEVKLFAYCRTQVYGGTQDKTYKATVLDGNGEKHYYTATLSANADRVVFDISATHEIMQLLLQGGSLSVRLDDTDNSRNVYLFTIDDCSGFSDAVAKYVSDNGQLPSPTFTSESMPVNGSDGDTKSISEAQVGETVLFGEYEQDGDAGNGPEPIEWVVLCKDGDKMLLLSKYALESMQFNAVQDEVSWEGSSLRAWLNGDFYQAAFSQEEQGEIVETSLATAANAYYGTRESETVDNVFLLSFEETSAYMATDQDLICLPTAHAVESGAYTGMNGAADWWLRTSGESGATAVHANPIGVTSLGGYYVSSLGYAVRPAIWIEP